MWWQHNKFSNKTMNNNKTLQALHIVKLHNMTNLSEEYLLINSSDYELSNNSILRKEYNSKEKAYAAPRSLIVESETQRVTFQQENISEAQTPFHIFEPQVEPTSIENEGKTYIVIWKVSNIVSK